VVLRSSPIGGGAAALAVPVTKIIHDLDPDLPVYDVSTMAERVRDSLARRRLAMSLLGVFAGLAAILAVIGVYGVVAYWVQQRTREIGIRVALGASRESVYGLVSRELGVMLGAGLLTGVAVAAASTRLLSSLLYGIAAIDPITFILSLLILTAAAVSAAWLPALRAVRISPMTALRSE
jgi:ABC-type antimicrobial peptide transport system permease subunit